MKFKVLVLRPVNKRHDEKLWIRIKANNPDKAGELACRVTGGVKVLRIKEIKKEVIVDEDCNRRWEKFY